MPGWVRAAAARASRRDALATRRVVGEARASALSATADPGACRPRGRRRPCRPRRGRDGSGTGRGAGRPAGRRRGRRHQRGPATRRVLDEAAARSCAASSDPTSATIGSGRRRLARRNAARRPAAVERAMEEVVDARPACRDRSPTLTVDRLPRARAGARPWRPSSAASPWPGKCRAPRRFPRPTDRRRIAARRCGPAADRVAPARQRAIEGEEVDARGPDRPASSPSSSVTCTCAAALGRRARARALDEQPAHGDGGNRDEVRAVLPARRLSFARRRYASCTSSVACTLCARSRRT